MQFKGKIIEALPVVTGQGARGSWVKQGFVLEYDSGQYPKSIAFDVFGNERLQKFRISVGEELICDIDFKAVKGKNGGTFNSVDCWNVTRVNQVQQQVQPQGCQTYYPNQQPQQAPTQAPQQTAYVPPQQPAYAQPQPQAPMQQPAAAEEQNLPF